MRAHRHLFALFLLLTVHHRAQAGLVLTNFLSFANSSNGAYPNPLTLASDGALYGTLRYCPYFGESPFFQLTTNGAFTIISYTSGQVIGPLVQRRYDSSFYGTAAGVFNARTNGYFVYIAPINPNELLEAPDGNFYGTISDGPTNGAFGSAFKMTFNGRVTTLHIFTNGFDGASPYSGLILAADGNFYGTTMFGGANNAGTIFRLTQAGVVTILYSFTGGSDGYKPTAKLLQAADGYLYGLTEQGGTNNQQNGGDGTLFRITTNGTFTTVTSFDGTNALSPGYALVQAHDGTLIGASAQGGRYGNGTVFQVSTNGEFISTYPFGTLTDTNGTSIDGATPSSPLTPAPDNTFYGTTYSGGTSNNGTVYHLILASPSAPVITAIANAGSVLLVWNSQPGRVYQLQCTTNPIQTSWANLGPSITASNSTTAVLDPILPAPSQRFYRVALPP